MKVLAKPPSKPNSSGKRIHNLLNMHQVNWSVNSFLKQKYFLNKYAELLTFTADYLGYNQIKKRSKLNVHHNKYI